MKVRGGSQEYFTDKYIDNYTKPRPEIGIEGGVGKKEGRTLLTEVNADTKSWKSDHGTEART